MLAAIVAWRNSLPIAIQESTSLDADAFLQQIPVYEFQFGTDLKEHVMRRRQDDWINATHILKAAGFDKPARTRILEREVQKDIHEKIQGGYGKYQGSHIQLSGPQPLTSLQVLGFPSSMASNLPSEMPSTSDSAPSSSSFRAMKARHLLRDTPASPSSRRSQRYLNGVVSVFAELAFSSSHAD